MQKKRLLGWLLFAAVLALLFAVFRTVPFVTLLEGNALEACSSVLVQGGPWDISPTEASPEERDAVLALLAGLRVRWGGGADGIQTKRSEERMYTLTLQDSNDNGQVMSYKIWFNESRQLCVAGGSRYIGDTAQLTALLGEICDFPPPESPSK